MLQRVGSLDVLAGISGEWNTLSIVGRCESVLWEVCTGFPGIVMCRELVDTSVTAPGGVTTSIGTGMGTTCITGCGLVFGVEIPVFLSPVGSFCSLYNG